MKSSDRKKGILVLIALIIAMGIVGHFEQEPAPVDQFAAVKAEAEEKAAEEYIMQTIMNANKQELCAIQPKERREW